MFFNLLMPMQEKDLSKPLRYLTLFTPIRLVSILLDDIGYAWWRLHHWDGRFSAYYAHVIKKRLEKERAHRTPGRKRQGPNSFLADGKILTPTQSKEHGHFAFKKIVALGLQPHHMCVDFGCGNLRVGKHLIGYLHRNRYWGLDVTDRFFQNDLDLLEDGINQAKSPHLGAIEEPLLKRVADLKPDYLICVSVIMHVPPHELAPFFDKLLRLMATQTRLLLFFDEAPSDIRTGSKSWAYSVANLTDHILRRQPHAQVCCQPGSTKGRIGKIAFRRSILISEGAQGTRPALPQNLRGSFVPDRMPIC